MAAIDKTYGNKKQWHELFEWLYDNERPLILYLRKPPPDDGLNHVIAHFSLAVEVMLLSECPLGWLKDDIRERHGLAVEDEQSK